MRKLFSIFLLFFSFVSISVLQGMNNGQTAYGWIREKTTSLRKEASHKLQAMKELGRNFTNKAVCVTRVQGCSLSERINLAQALQNMRQQIDSLSPITQRMKNLGTPALKEAKQQFLSAVDTLKNNIHMLEVDMNNFINNRLNQEQKKKFLSLAKYTAVAVGSVLITAAAVGIGSAVANIGSEQTMGQLLSQHNIHQGSLDHDFLILVAEAALNEQLQLQVTTMLNSGEVSRPAAEAALSLVRHSPNYVTRAYIEEALKQYLGASR